MPPFKENQPSAPQQEKQHDPEKKLAEAGFVFGVKKLDGEVINGEVFYPKDAVGAERGPEIRVISKIPEDIVGRLKDSILDEIERRKKLLQPYKEFKTGTTSFPSVKLYDLPYDIENPTEQIIGEVFLAYKEGKLITVTFLEDDVNNFPFFDEVSGVYVRHRLGLPGFGIRIEDYSVEDKHALQVFQECLDVHKEDMSFDGFLPDLPSGGDYPAARELTEEEKSNWSTDPVYQSFVQSLKRN